MVTFSVTLCVFPCGRQPNCVRTTIVKQVQAIGACATALDMVHAPALSPCHSTSAASNGSAWAAFVFKHGQPKVPLWLMPGGEIRSASPPFPASPKSQTSKMPNFPCNTPPGHSQCCPLKAHCTSTPRIGACPCSAVAPAAVIRPNAVSPFAYAARASPPSSQGCGRVWKVWDIPIQALRVQG